MIRRCSGILLGANADLLQYILIVNVEYHGENPVAGVSSVRDIRHGHADFLLGSPRIRCSPREIGRAIAFYVWETHNHPSQPVEELVNT
jgi:hypothetical protein